MLLNVIYTTIDTMLTIGAFLESMRREYLKWSDLKRCFLIQEVQFWKHYESEKRFSRLWEKAIDNTFDHPDGANNVADTVVNIRQ
jgi:hypothetical protein